MDRCSVFEDYLDWGDDRRFDESKRLKVSLEHDLAATECTVALVESREQELAHQVQLLADGDIREALHKISVELWQVDVDERGFREALEKHSRSISLVKALLARAKQTTLANGVADMSYYRGLFIHVYCRVVLEVTGDCLIARGVDCSELRRLQLARIRTVCCTELPSSIASKGLYSEYALSISYAKDADGQSGQSRSILFHVREIREAINSIAVGSGGLSGLIADDSCNFTGFCAALVSALSVYCQTPSSSSSSSSSSKSGIGERGGGSNGPDEANLNGDHIHFESEGECIFVTRSIERRWSFDGGPLRRAVARTRVLSEGSPSCSSSSSSASSCTLGGGSSAALATPLKSAVHEATSTPLSPDRPSFAVSGLSSRYSIAVSTPFSPYSLEPGKQGDARVSDSQSLSAVTTLESSSHNASSGHSYKGDDRGGGAVGRVRSLLDLLALLREDRDAVSASLVEMIVSRERLRMDVAALRLVTHRCRGLLVRPLPEGAYEDLLVDINRNFVSQWEDGGVLSPLRGLLEELAAAQGQLARLQSALEEIAAGRVQNGARLRRLQKLELLTHSGRAPSGADIDQADLYDVAI